VDTAIVIGVIVLTAAGLMVSWTLSRPRALRDKAGARGDRGLGKYEAALAQAPRRRRGEGQPAAPIDDRQGPPPQERRGPGFRTHDPEHESGLGAPPAEDYASKPVKSDESDDPSDSG
jgi:hypothetical protein